MAGDAFCLLLGHYVTETTTCRLHVALPRVIYVLVCCSCSDLRKRRLAEVAVAAALSSLFSEWLLLSGFLLGLLRLSSCKLTNGTWLVLAGSVGTEPLLPRTATILHLWDHFTWHRSATSSQKCSAARKKQTENNVSSNRPWPRAVSRTLLHCDTLVCPDVGLAMASYLRSLTTALSSISANLSEFCDLKYQVQSWIWEANRFRWRIIAWQRGNKPRKR